MKHCDKCDVDIVDNINNCPLCGRDVSNTSEEQSFVCYPDNKVWVSKRNFVINFLFWAAMIGMAISVFIELIIFHRIQYNWYVITGVALFVLDVLMPTKLRWSFSGISLFISISICLYILFLELFTNSFGWGVYYVIPLFILFMSLYSTLIILIRNYYKGYEFIVCLLTHAILGLALFLYNILSGGIMWPSLAAFATATTCFITFLIFRFKKVKNQFEKRFFI